MQKWYDPCIGTGEGADESETAVQSAVRDVRRAVMRISFMQVPYSESKRPRRSFQSGCLAVFPRQHHQRLSDGAERRGDGRLRVHPDRIRSDSAFLHYYRRLRVQS